MEKITQDLRALTNIDLYTKDFENRLVENKINPKNIEAEIVVEDAGGGADSDPRANVNDDATAAALAGSDSASASATAASSRRPFSAVLARQAFRAGVVDDLLELRAFLRQRASDLRGKEATTLLASAPASIRARVSPESMSSLAES